MKEQNSFNQYDHNRALDEARQNQIQQSKGVSKSEQNIKEAIAILKDVKRRRLAANEAAIVQSAIDLLETHQQSSQRQEEPVRDVCSCGFWPCRHYPYEPKDTPPKSDTKSELEELNNRLHRINETVDPDKVKAYWLIDYLTELTEILISKEDRNE